MRIVHLFVSYAHVNLCHIFSSSWCQGLAATSACGSSWTCLFTFFIQKFIDATSKFNIEIKTFLKLMSVVIYMFYVLM